MLVSDLSDAWQKLRDTLPFRDFCPDRKSRNKVSKRSGCEHKRHAFDIACECVHRFWVSSSKHFFSQYFAHISHNACLCHFFTWCAVIQRQFALDLRTKELLKGFFCPRDCGLVLGITKKVCYINGIKIWCEENIGLFVFFLEKC